MLYFRVSLAVVLTVALNANAGPGIEIVADQHIFGKAAQRTRLVHDFWVRSTGDEPLRITKIVPGCGCTQVPLIDSVIAPGDSTRLTLYFETRNYRGNVTKRPYFETNASDDKNYLRIYSEVLVKPELDTPLVISPYNVDVSQFTAKARRRSRFTIQNKSQKDFQLTMVEPGHGNFEVELPKKVPAGESVEVIIIVNKEKIQSEFEDSITFSINDDFQTRYTVAVKRMYVVK